MNSDWSWARLNRQQLDLIKEAEETLGADILMAYRPDQRADARGELITQSGFQVASLNESQLECLQGLEQQLDSVVVAYQRAG